MKIGFISDIHGNAEALEAALTSLEKQHLDRLYCLGDIVGYGA
ncbi:MAG: YfcE family phosphodiesterase, partial [Calditrichaeota bacterium]|nr:YfcE family phosphodiesterase [Calditrichota bacterium]